MAENKQYITHIQDNGSIMVSEDVIGTIVAHAAEEVEGVVGLCIKAGADLAEMIGKKNWGRGMKITIDENNSVSVECNILIRYGQSVVNVAKSVQESVTGALESVAGVTVASVNVNVSGIERK